MGNRMVVRYRPMRLFLTMTRMRRISVSMSFVADIMAGVWGRQLQIDKNNVAAGVFFELLLRLLRCFRNFRKICAGASPGPAPSRHFDGLRWQPLWRMQGFDVQKL